MTFFRAVFAAMLASSAAAFAQAPLSYHFVSTRELCHAVVYDNVHAQFFVSVPEENMVYVTAAGTGAVVAKIPTESPFEMALSSDGSRIYVTGSAQSTDSAGVETIAVIDTATRHVVDNFFPNVLPVNQSSAGPSYSPVHAIPRWLGVLNDGSVIFTPQYGYPLLYDPIAHTSSGVGNNVSGTTVTSSRNGSLVAVSGLNTGNFGAMLYAPGSPKSVATISFPANFSGDIALSPDGSLLLGGGHALFSTQTHALIATLAPPSAASGSVGIGHSTFSPDGSRIYVIQPVTVSVAAAGGGTTQFDNTAIAVYQTSNAQFLGYVPVPCASGYGCPYGAIAADNSGHVVIADSILEGGDLPFVDLGFLQLDAGSPSLTLPLAVSHRGLSFGFTNAGSATSPAARSSGATYPTGTQVYFDSIPAATTVSAGGIQIQPPAHPAGYVNVSTVYPDGWTVLQPRLYSYGPSLLFMNINAGTTQGGDIISFQGAGINGTVKGVTIGGRPAPQTDSRSTGIVNVVTPQGSAGPADVVIDTAYGSLTLPGAFRYLQEQVVANLVPLSVVPDTPRNKLYVADYNTGAVLSVDNTTLAVTTLFLNPARPAYALAMTPDGSKLVSASYKGFSLDVIDLATGKNTLTTFPSLGNTNTNQGPYRVTTTSRGTAIVTVNNTLQFLQGATYEVDLTSGVTYPLHPARTFSDEPALSAASADGSLVYLTMDGNLGISAGSLDLWSAAVDGIALCCSVGDVGDIATDDLGDRVSEGSFLLDSRLRITQDQEVSQFYSNSDYGNTVEGLRLHSSGALSYTPFTKLIKIADVHHGGLDLTIADTSGSIAGPSNLAISHDGARLYVADTSGLRVMDLGVAPLSIGSVTPASGSSSGGTSVLVRGSGFVQGSTVTVDGRSAPATFIDATQLQIVIPAIAAAKVNVSVTNPAGASYSLDAAYDASVITVQATPTLKSITPPITSSGRDITLQLYGSGFVVGATAYLDGVPGETLLVSSSQLSASFNSISGPRTASVTAANPGSGASNAIPLSITNYLPYGISISPSSTQAGSSGFQLLVKAGNGDAFAPSAVVNWNGTPLPTVYLSYGYVQATVPAPYVASAGSYDVTVSVPQVPTSSPVPFIVTAPTPILTVSSTTLNLGPVLLGGIATQTLTISSAGQAALSGITATASGAGFTVQNNCTGNLAYGQSCTVIVSGTAATAPVNYTAAGTLQIASNGGAATVNLAVFVGEIRLSNSMPDADVAAGSSATTTISGTSYGYLAAGTLTFACTGLPSGAACQFSPSTASLRAVSLGYNDSISSVLTISTTAPTYVLLEPATRTIFFAGLVLLGAGFWRKRRPTLLICSCILMAAAGSGCGAAASSASAGGGGGTRTGGTPPGSYAVLVSATSPGGSAQTTVNLRVR